MLALAACAQPYQPETIAYLEQNPNRETYARINDIDAGVRMRKAINAAGEESGYWACLRADMTETGKKALAANNPIDTADELTQSIADAQVACETQFQGLAEALRKAYDDPKWGTPAELDELRFLIYREVFEQMADG